MRHRLFYLWLTFAAGGFLLSCGTPPEAKYEGLPLSVWVERLQSPEPEVRQDALRVIASAGPSARRVEYFIAKFAREEVNPDVKMQAIQALQAMGAVTVEFEEFIKLYQGPIIPSEEEETSLVDSLEEEFGDKISGDDDLQYLKGLSENDSSAQEDFDNPPEDSAELRKWMEGRLSEETGILLESLSNPNVLREILLSGSDLEKEYAVRKLASQSGISENIVEALKKAASDPNTKIAEAAKEALKNWQTP